MVFFLKMRIEDSSVFIADGTSNHMDRQICIQQQFGCFPHTKYLLIYAEKEISVILPEDISKVVAIVIHCRCKLWKL